MNRTLLRVLVVFAVAAMACAQENAEDSHGSAASKIQIGFRGGMSIVTMTGRLWGVSRLLTDKYADNPDVDWSGGFTKGKVSGMVFGGFIDYRLSRSFSVQSELLYVRKGVKAHGEIALSFIDFGTVEADLTEKLKLTYLEIPVLIKYHLPVGGKIEPSLFAGPALALKLAGTYDYDLSEIVDLAPHHTVAKPDIANMSSTDFGIVMGADVGIPVGRATLVVDVRYTLGLSKQFGSSGTEGFDGFDQNEIPSPFPVAVFDMTGRVASIPDMKNRVLSLTAGMRFDL